MQPESSKYIKAQANPSAQVRTTTVTVIATALLLACATCFLVGTVLRNSMYQTPLTLWRSAAISSPDKRRTHQNYAHALSSAGMHEEALEQLRILVALPDDGTVPLRDVHRHFGVVYFRLGRIDESIAEWKKGLEYDNRDPALMNNLSIALMKKQLFDEALAIANMAALADPLMPEPVNARGEIFMAKGEYAKAAECFMKHVQLRPEDSRGYWKAAQAYEKAGEHEKSLRMVNQFLPMVTEPSYREEAMRLKTFLQHRLEADKKP